MQQPHEHYETVTASPYYKMFTPDICLPVQLLPPPETKPSHRLLVALLEDAWNGLTKLSYHNTPARRERYRQDRAWFLSDDTNWPFSFVNVCLFLRISPRPWRKAIRENPERFPDLPPIRLGEREAFVTRAPQPTIEITASSLQEFPYYSIITVGGSPKHIRLPHSELKSPPLLAGQTGPLTVNLAWARWRQLA